MKSAIYSAVLLVAVASAAPTLQKRDGIDDVILNYALTLEYLEREFYKEGLARFTAADFASAGFNEANFYKNLKRISKDEASHVSVIKSVQKAAGFSTTSPCTYDFGVTDVKSFMKTATVLEGVGVTAYLGAAAKVTNKDYLTAAGSILTVEARHNAFIRNARKQSPYPQAYDTPLDFSQVYSLAAPFIKSCPSTNPTLPVTNFPNLTPTAAKNVKRGERVTFRYGGKANVTDGESLFLAWPTALGSIFQKARLEDAQARTVSSVVPDGGLAGPLGQSYAILVNQNGTLSDDTTIAGPAIVNVVTPYLS